ncbi:HAD family phosphatase [Cyanobium sp. FGCU-6]|nr:HAD family phosphatase [Cyanobium sp. FGCU6]
MQKLRKVATDFFYGIFAQWLTPFVVASIGFAYNSLASVSFRVPLRIAVWILALASVLPLARYLRQCQWRHKQIRFLKEDSATRSLDLFIDIIQREVWLAMRVPENGFHTVLPSFQKYILLRKQPMQIILVDCMRIAARAKSLAEHSQVLSQVSHYLEFMRFYKKMAVPRIVAQCLLYFKTFKDDLDIILIYGHSTVVLEAVVAGYRESRFTIVVVEDKQYHKESLNEHQIVCNRLKSEKVVYHLIAYDQTDDLLKGTRSIRCKIGGDIAIHPERRIHALIGCERVDTSGNALIPALTKGTVSDTAALITRISRKENNNCVTRLVIISESYKVRDYQISDLSTHVPLQGYSFDSLKYILGIQRLFPAMREVRLYEIPSINVYAYINEFGVFPRIKQKFNLSYCQDVFERETSILGFFAGRQQLKFEVFHDIEAVLIDLNGIIIDDEDLHRMAFHAVVFDLCGGDLTPSLYTRLCFGRSDAEGITNILTEYSIDASVDALVAKKQSYYIDSLSNSDIHIDPSVQTLLENLVSHGYLIGLVTASSRLEVDVILERLQIGKYFKVLITNDDVNNSKPSTEGYILASDSLDVPISRCLVIEDSLETIKQLMLIARNPVTILKQTDVSISPATYTIDSINEILSY